MRGPRGDIWLQESASQERTLLKWAERTTFAKPSGCEKALGVPVTLVSEPGVGVSVGVKNLGLKHQARELGLPAQGSREPGEVSDGRKEAGGRWAQEGGSWGGLSGFLMGPEGSSFFFF